MALKILFMILTCTAFINGSSRDFSNIQALSVHEDNFDVAICTKSGELIYQSNGEGIEDITAQQRTQRSACIIPISYLPKLQPVYISGGRLITPYANSHTIRFYPEEELVVTCTGINNFLTHNNNNLSISFGVLKCQSDNAFTGPGWLTGQVTFESIKCLHRNHMVEIKVNYCAGNNLKIGIGFEAGNQYHYTMKSCFNKQDANVLYVTYTLTPENIISNSIRSPDFYQGKWFPMELNVDYLYGKASQNNSFTFILGKKSANKYLKNKYLTRGHLAASADFIFSSARLITYTFTNCAPQWDTFNNGNWNTLETNLRAQINKMEYRTQIYTGTWDILQLKNGSGKLKKIYLYPYNKMIPVPLWFYKVVYEPSLQQGIVFLGLNNPYVTLGDARRLVFCRNVLVSNSRFSWLNMNIDNTIKGYMIGCDINDFRKTVNHLPPFTVKGLLF